MRLFLACLVVCLLVADASAGCRTGLFGNRRAKTSQSCSSGASGSCVSQTMPQAPAPGSVFMDSNGNSWQLIPPKK